MMKKILLFICVFTCSFSNAQSGLLSGTGYAPDFTVTDINGNNHNLYSYLANGKMVVLEFLSTTCSYCQNYTTGTENSYQTYGPSGVDAVEFLGLEVNAGSSDLDLSNFATNFNVGFPLCNDIVPSNLNYQLYYIPSYYVIYPDSSYTTICPLYCNDTSTSFNIEDLLNTAIQAGLPPVYGCTDSIASNYDSTATVDDGSCLYHNNAIDLFISEYAEGSGTNKYVEIFNGTGQDVDLSQYQLWKVTNGGTWPEYTFNLSGILTSGDVYIVYSSSSSVNPIISSSGDVTWSQVTWTGDDAVGLAKSDAGLIPSFSLIDLVGEDGPDPGNGWDVAGVADATKDHTLKRKCDVNQGNTNWSLSSGSNSLDSEWEVLPQNDWSDIGQHIYPCNSISIYGCMDSSAFNYDSTATVDDGSCVFPIYGCTDSLSLNYNPLSNIDDGSCCFISGCTNPLATNFDPFSCFDDGSCINPNFGCLDTIAMNYDSTANTNDGSCIFLTDKVDLFFSEYGEGNSNNKYLEIYNPTSNIVDLSSYALTRVSNAPTTIGVYEYWVDFDTSSFIYPGDVYIIAHPSSDSIILSQSDMTYSALSNGDDGFSLVYGSKPSIPLLPGEQYVILDFIGDFNGDPGAGWDVAGVSQATKDHVLVRKCDVNIGNSNWLSSSGTDSLNSEWIVLANENWSNLGLHSLCSPVFGCTDSTALNYNSSATSDDGSCIPFVYGCMDSTATNYNSTANTDDGSCTYDIYGCIDPTATNFNSNANIDDGSCTYSSVCSKPVPTGVFISDIIQVQARINWDNMSNTITTTSPTTHYINAGNYYYSPSTLSINIGDTVVWINDGGYHNVNFDISSITGQSYNNPESFITNPTSSNVLASYVFTVDGSYSYDCSVGLHASNGMVGGIQVNSVSTPSCMALKYYIQVREVGTSSWTNKLAQDAGLCNFGLPTTTKVLNGLTPSTQYEYRMKAAYCNTTGTSVWTPMGYFTTADECPNVTNLTATPGPQPNKVVFSWDTVGAYSMVRIKLRVDSISNPTGSDWQMAGGFGVNYPTLSVNKWGVTPGEYYRGQARTWCDPSGGIFRSPNWTGLIWWTQPTAIRVDGTTTINNFSLFPNPTSGIFQVIFDDKNDEEIKLTIYNSLGELVHSVDVEPNQTNCTIDLSKKSKGVYTIWIHNNLESLHRKIVVQ